MHTDLLTVARTLAERGWLPGIAFTDGLLIQANKSGMVVATTADLHLAAHSEIVRRGWSYRIGAYVSITDDLGPQLMCRMAATGRGTDTLALLRCLLAACGAQEKTNA